MTTIETIWHELVTSALLGTERRPFVLPRGESVVGELLTPLAAAAPEAALLGAAAVVSQYRRTGSSAAPATEPLPTASTHEALQPCSARSRYHLTQLLGGQHRELLGEWLNLAATAGICAPPQYLPALLDLGNTQPAQRTAIAPLLGTRGRWLAAQNDDWHYAILPTATFSSLNEAQLLDQWETADRANRLVLLQATRQHAPERTHGLLRATWAQEKADDRAAFLEALAYGLSMDDEPLLEAALDDRAKDVRRIAATLLTRLPESRLAARMRERAHVHMSLKRRMLRTAVIEVTLPIGYDSAMQRDSIEQKPHGTLGEKAWWLQQILGTLPPHEWTTQWRLTPSELIAAAAQGEWRELVLGAWLVATTRHSDADWAEALLTSGALPVAAEVETLIDVLPAERRERYVTQIIRANAPLTATLLRHCTHPWSEAFGRTVLAYFRSQISSGPRPPSWVLLTLVKESARYLPVTLAGSSGDWPTEHPAWSSWQGAVERMLVVLQFRAEMRAALERG